VITTTTHGDRRRPSPAESGKCDLLRESYDERVAFERISDDPQRRGGVPTSRARASRSAWSSGRLARGRTIDDLLADYQYPEHDEVRAALEYAAAVVNEGEVPIVRPA